MQYVCSETSSDFMVEMEAALSLKRKEPAMKQLCPNTQNVLLLEN